MNFYYNNIVRWPRGHRVKSVGRRDYAIEYFFFFLRIFAYYSISHARITIIITESVFVIVLILFSFDCVNSKTQTTEISQPGSTIYNSLSVDHNKAKRLAYGSLLYICTCIYIISYFISGYVITFRITRLANCVIAYACILQLTYNARRSAVYIRVQRIISASFCETTPVHTVSV